VSVYGGLKWKANAVSPEREFWPLWTEIIAKLDEDIVVVGAQEMARLAREAHQPPTHIKTDDDAPAAYRVVWDSWWPLQCYEFCHADPVNANLSAFGIDANGNGNGSMSVAHGGALTLWDNGLGLYPYWTCSNFPDPTSCNDTNAVNGGVPQLAILNLPAHIAKLKADINNVNGCAECGDYSLPPGFDGLGVLDWETWDFAWTRMMLGGWDAKNDIRVNKSIELVLTDHPSMPITEAKLEAGKRWDAAAKILIEATLSTLHELRPNGKFGFYGYPDCDGYSGAAGEKLGCSAPFQAMNDNELGWLWNASSALYPSWYVPRPPGEYPNGNTTYDSNQREIDNAVAEAVRVRSSAPEGKRPDVFLYARSNYYAVGAFAGKAWSQNESGLLQGARSHCRFVRPTCTHPLHTRSTGIFGASFSEATLGPNPRLLQHKDLGTTVARAAAHGAHGVVLWGSSEDCQTTAHGGRTCAEKCDDQSTFIRSLLGSAWPWTFKSFWYHPVYLISDSLYKIYRGASE
jgi:hyaluronoglucosaminidase